MSLNERDRSALYQGLSHIIDEEPVGAMLSYFPARDVEEPATKEFVRAQIADVRTEIHSSANRIIIWAVGASTAMVGFVLALTRLT